MPSDTQNEIIREVMEEKPFDFSNVKVIIKKGNEQIVEEIFLKRQWVFDNIPHFRPVMDNVNN